MPGATAMVCLWRGLRPNEAALHPDEGKPSTALMPGRSPTLKNAQSKNANSLDIPAQVAMRPVGKTDPNFLQ